ncbi:GPI mannosyltransferase 2 [Plakobranchus ocellatus]|uniref:GPI mannosyltransferase 2 n=1 Tax=Plakobranchus ocellatus TaxID=259542 RepID=A0AAV4BJK8_9GAST|nr:GPI mannosyltransferase 2 [Plakobranchus ocellatus]
MEAPVRQIVKFAVASRLLIVLLQLASNVALPDHDADVFNPPVNKTDFGHLDSIVHQMLGGFRRWDAIYFTHIMQYGYSYENCIAFFPFFPWLASAAVNVLSSLQLLHVSSWILLISIVVNITLFALTSLGLYKLGKDVLKDEYIAYYAALFFCINPASIFMTAPYSETLYFFSLVYALNGLNANAKYAASLLIGLGVFTRSNGLIGTGFVLHSIAKSFLASCHYMYILYQRSPIVLSKQKVLLIVTKAALQTLVCSLLCVFPFFTFQYYTYLKFCLPESRTAGNLEPSIIAYGRERGYHIQGDNPSSWCYDSIPLSYSYIQRQHWGVGFLQYYTWIQLPNFLLAFPIVCLSLRACYHFFNLDRKAALYLGLWDFRAVSLHRTLMRKKLDSVEYDEAGFREPGNVNSNTEFFLSNRNPGGFEQPEVPQSLKQMPSVSDTVVFTIHLISLVTFGCLFVHIQVLTRLLCSSSPLIYWYCGTLFVSKCQRPILMQSSSGGLQGFAVAAMNKLHLHFIATLLSSWSCLSQELKCIVAYFILYFIIGTVMFSNFLPWT